MEGTFSSSICCAHGTGNNYKFKMQANGDGTFRILTKVSNFARCADGQSGSSTNYDDGGIIRQTTYSANDTSQRWYFYPVRQEDDTAIEASATYTADKNFTKTVTDAAGGVTTYFNNTNSGVLTSVRDPLSNVTSYTYDKSNRVTQTTGPAMGGNAAQSYVKYTYSQDRLTQIDANGNLSSMLFNKTGGTMNGVWYYYDGLNRLTRINNPNRFLIRRLLLNLL